MIIATANDETIEIAPSAHGIPTEKVFVWQRGARVAELAWDPRETGGFALLENRRWSTPPEEMSSDDVAAWIDAVWRLAPAAGGLRVLLEQTPRTGCYVVRRWDRPADGAVFRFVAERHPRPTEPVGFGYVELARLERTARLPVPRLVEQLSSPHLPALAGVAREGASWLEPDQRPLDDAEWRDALDRLSRASADDWYLTHSRPRFVELDAMPS